MGTRLVLSAGLLFATGCMMLPAYAPSAGPHYDVPTGARIASGGRTERASGYDVPHDRSARTGRAPRADTPYDRPGPVTRVTGRSRATTVDYDSPSGTRQVTGRTRQPRATGYDLPGPRRAPPAARAPNKPVKASRTRADVSAGRAEVLASSSYGTRRPVRTLTVGVRF